MEFRGVVLGFVALVEGLVPLFLEVGDALVVGLASRHARFVCSNIGLAFFDPGLTLVGLLYVLHLACLRDDLV